MSMNERIRKSLLVCVFAITVFGAMPTFAKENCALKSPPRAAAVEMNHGFFFFIFPRKIPDSYVGCQTMWNQEGKTVLVLMFDVGKLTSYREFDGLTEKASLTCRYSRRVLKTSSKECPAYADVKDGFKTVPEMDEPSVPIEIDPRLFSH